MNSRLLKTLLLSTTLLGACMADSDATDQTEASAPDTRIHMMPLHNADAKVSNSAPAGAHLQFFGGPVLKNVNIRPVYWNSATAFQSNLNSFYKAVTQSRLYDMLFQYSSIGRGSGVNGIVDNRATASVTDAQVQAELKRLITAGTLVPTSNTYFPVHFPAGMNITAPDGSRSCVVFCAYHGTFTQANGINVNYGVIPDQGGGCAGGCGNNAQRVNNLFSVSSHELVEATTDPAVGLATVFGPPLAWYDPNFGEIGDICNGQQGTTVGGDGVTYVVQTEFSNSANNCVTQ